MKLGQLHMTRNIIATFKVALAVCAITSCDQNLTVTATQGALSGAKTVEAPVFAPAGGVYNNDVSVTIATVPMTASIVYSLDGSAIPSRASSIYAGAILVSSTTTIKAMAVMANYSDSAIMSETYTLTVAAPTVDVASGAYGPAQTLTLSSATTGAEIHYTTNGSTPSCTDSTGTVSVNATMTVKAIACKSNYTNSGVAIFSYTINGAVATPAATVTNGSCGAPQALDISSSTMGSDVHFTTGDGTQANPTCASPTGTISLTSSMTVKAIACKANFSDSAVATFSYSVETQNGQFCGGDGTAGEPYRICNLDTLANMTNYLSASYIITRDIDASATATSNSGAGWAPVGTTAAPFTGTLNGQDHFICGLKIDRPTTDYIGLFGSATSTISRISFTDVGIVGKDWVGSVAGQSTGVIQNVAVQGSVRGTNNVGGIVGNFTGAAASMSDSNANNIVVSGTSLLGGLAGQNSGDAIITRSWSSGTVTGDPVSGYNAGGLVGRLSKGTISRSYSSATVSANNHVGGLIGMFYQWGAGTCLIEYSHASGNVTAYGTTAVTDGFGSGSGGLAGVGGDCLLIRKSYATGNVTSQHTLTSDALGGLVGRASWGAQNIEDSYATGNVSSGGGIAGGIIGYADSLNIKRSYATGNVTVPSSVAAGGLVSSGGIAVSNSFSTGVVSGTATTLHGGLIGTKSSTLTNSYWLKPTGSPFTCVGNDATNAECTTLSDSSFFSLAGGSLFSTWDFTAVWTFPAAGGLPILRE